MQIVLLTMQIFAVSMLAWLGAGKVGGAQSLIPIMVIIAVLRLLGVRRVVHWVQATLSQLRHSRTDERVKREESEPLTKGDNSGTMHSQPDLEAPELLSPN